MENSLYESMENAFSYFTFACTSSKDRDEESQDDGAWYASGFHYAAESLLVRATDVAGGELGPDGGKGRWQVPG